MQNGILDGLGPHTNRSKQKQTQQKPKEQQQKEKQDQSPQPLDWVVVELQTIHCYDCGVCLVRICICP